MGTKTVLKMKSFDFFDNLCFITTEARIAELDLPIRVSTQFFFLTSVTRKCNPKVLELLYLLQRRNIHLQRALIRMFCTMKKATSVLAVPFATTNARVECFLFLLGHFLTNECEVSDFCLLFKNGMV